MDVTLLTAGLRAADEGEFLAEPFTLGGLAAEHPLWAGDLAALPPRPETAEEDPEDLIVCGRCSSTMDVARTLCARGRLAAWGSVITPRQTAGRGQLRRAWMSDPGNMLATLVCPPEEKPWNDLRPLLLGHLFSLALSSVGPGVRVKWPNDLLCDDRKIAGMLVEERGGCVLAGIGVNLSWAPDRDAMRGGHSVEAGRFAPHDPSLGPLRLWRALVNHVKTGYCATVHAYAPKEFLTIFRSRLAWVGRHVLVHEGNGVRYEAIVKGISEEGGLVLDRAGKEMVLFSGDVTPA